MKRTHFILLGTFLLGAALGSGVTSYWSSLRVETLLSFLPASLPQGSAPVADATQPSLPRQSETASPKSPALAASLSSPQALTSQAGQGTVVPTALPSSVLPSKAIPQAMVENALALATGPLPTLPFAPSASSFILHKMGAPGGPTLLVVGGIQGDEPGGFSAAALIASHYTITKGAVWVVPDLNLPSILLRNRGSSGDMNRKFAFLNTTDPDYATVTRIKEVLTESTVDLVLNLHDGSGFYRPAFEDKLHNPGRWGQSVIIDQEDMSAPRFANLQGMAQTATEDANKKLLHPEHRYHLRNTHTRQGDKEMEKTLSYFAVCSGKPAFGLEASKEFSTEYRSYYHLLLVESFMRQMGIEFTRNFTLTPQGVLATLNSNLMLAAFDSKLVLPLDNARTSLSLLPFKQGEAPALQASKPLLLMVPEKDGTWRVAYGNRTLTRFKPQFMEFDNSLPSLGMQCDTASPVTVPLGNVVGVRDSFTVTVPEGYRVNAIGARKEQNGTEAGVELFQKDFLPQYSLDKDGSTYRVEVYKGEAFAGMVLVRFGETGHGPSTGALTATSGPESVLGF
ncbi:M99 family carboxypeptidase catalytic domain-containing protein [Desulfovibrio cuneatus]|uniref:M99 family carboxypeptidase catalytic domain-containing protein n=1 Tax=Desulfovibrio cuneatus TaxID=159728 RepID=UPI001FE03672|nr:M99 family carboxypeptidase catalytic domain-containing protein [Desulfovibrio cuneatus]